MKIGYVDLGGITTAPDGTITYDFAGHIHALGVDLDAAGGPAPWAQTNRSINWQDTNDNLAAEIIGYTNALGPTLRMQAGSVFPPGGPQTAAVEIQQSLPARISLTAGTQRATLLDGGGNSSFLKTAFSQNLGMDAGVAGPISVTAGWNVLVLDLAAPWPTNHFAFVASINPTGPDSTAGVEAGPLGLAQGFVRVNTSVDQDILIHFITAGN